MSNGVATILRMIRFRRDGMWGFVVFLFEGVGIGGAIGLVGFHFLEELLDVFGLVLEEVHVLVN